MTKCCVPGVPPGVRHVVIKFDGFSQSQTEKKAKRLKKAAEARGWQYVAEPDA